MLSTFHNLETARRALFAQQAALQTTGHNISNANTPGYSRQRVNFSATIPFPMPAFNNSVSAGQIGTGVEAGTVQRVREDFLDVQFRGENTKLGYWGARSDELAKMENILNEPSKGGLSQTLDQFWESLQGLADNPEGEVRSVVRQRGIAVADTFHYLNHSLTRVRGDTKNQIDVSVKEVNSLAGQINSLNKQIGETEPHGYLANDLYDQRDLLVDQLSQLVNVKVTPIESGGQSLDIAEGRYTVDIIDSNGKTFTLVDGEDLRTNRIAVSYSEEGDIDHFSVGGKEIPQDDVAFSGKLQGLKEAYNEDYPEMLHALDQMAYAFVNKFNEVHASGYGLNGETGTLFFASLSGDTDGAAQNIKVSDAIIDDLDFIAAANSEDSGAGDNQNAHDLADVITGSLSINGRETSLKDFFGEWIGGMAVDAQEANRLANNSLTLRQSAEQHRQSVSGVSLDEEMVNLIKYQHAYNAAARMVTTVDEILDRMINNMGIVGR